MSQENQSCLRFSLEETLWFRKGQEVAELVSISLDPDITIQENDQYVTIRGSLELTGEYNSFNENNDGEEETFTNQKYIQSVEERDIGVYEFLHRFPVDITIPYNRIQSIYDIDVVVESFDYTIPERSCLKLSAELTISGLYGVKQNDTELEVLARIDSVEVEEKGQDLLFAAEARKQQEEESVESHTSFPTFPYEKSNKTPLFQEYGSDGYPHTESAEHESTEELMDMDGKGIVFEESSSSFSKEESSPKKEGLLFSVQKFREHGNPHQEIMEITEGSPVEESTDLSGEEESSSSSSGSHPVKDWIKKKVSGHKKSMSLTEFFSRKVEEEEQARIKVCLVQKGDTLDRLAERYDVSITNLLKVNHLEINQDVHEGQVLYIPSPPLKK